MLKIHPLTKKKWRAFKSFKRSYYSLLLLTVLTLLSLSAELWINSRAVLVYYEGKIYFPTYGSYISAKTFGLDYSWETNYRELEEKFKTKDSSNFVIMPLIPYNPYENIFQESGYPPYPPSFTKRHFLGTDNTARDVFARLIYGYRIAFGFAIALLLGSYLIGIMLGTSMGYLGGAFDLIGLRLIEIWSNLPFLYIVIILASILQPSFSLLLLVMLAFSWTSITWYVRAATYKEKARNYTLAAKALGASSSRIMLRHILPNSLTTIISLIPFFIASAISSLTALDFLGFGLAAPTPSWGELLQQGFEQLSAPWIVGSVVSLMIFVLTLVNFIGEGLREAFDPKNYSYYQ